MGGRACVGRRRLQVVLVLAAVLSAVLATTPSLAADPVVLTSAAQQMTLGRHVDYLEDHRGSLTLDDVRSPAMASRWVQSTQDVPNFGMSTSTYWVRFDLVNPAPTPNDRVLEVGYASLRDVRLFVVRGGDVVETRMTGAQTPLVTRDIPHDDLLFDISVPPGARSTVLMRVASEGSVQIPLTLWTKEALIGSDQGPELGKGIYYGLMIVMVAYNLFVFAAVRDRSYLYYVAYVSALIGWQSVLDGIPLHYLWPGHPQWNFLFARLCMPCTGLFIGLFTRSFLDLSERLPRWHRMLSIVTYVFALEIPCAFFLPYRPLVLFMTFPAGLFFGPMCLVAGIRAWLRGVRPARFYVLAWTAFYTGSSTYILQKAGLIERTALTEHGWQIACALEVVLSSLALADRINILRAEKELMQREAADNLRREVERQTRELKEQAEKLKEVDRQKTHFFQNVSHELRTPLTLILNPLDEMTSDPAFAGEERVEVAAKNARRLLRLVNQLLDFQKLSAGRKEWKLVPIDFVAFARSCAEYFAPTCAAQGISFALGVPEGDERIDVRAEADALEKVVFNYLANALKYAPEQGHIELVVERVGAHARIAVKDDGQGISDEGKKKLFQLFSQVDAGGGAQQAGTGLGLALVKELTEAMGGRVGVESSAGKGSTFWAELPMADGGAGIATKPVLATGREMSEVAAAARASIRLSAAQRVAVEPPATAPFVLVVDDIADMRELVARTLARNGYRVATASGGVEALATARARKPDVVLTDWMMPGMSGPDLVAAIRADAVIAAVPVVLLTAKSDEESKLAGTNVGADAFLGKPFNEQELTSTVRNLVHLKEREREVERLNRHISENVLKRYLPPELVDDILSGRRSVDVEPEAVQATVLFGDLSGFTRTSGQLRASKMARLLNEYLSKMNDVVFAHGGTVDKYMGDGIMVIFGAPVRLEARQQVLRAARCALAMQRAMKELHARWRSEGLPEIALRIGIHHGPVVVGNFGDARRSDYTAIGPTVNLASRIEGQCPPGGVLVSGEVCDFLPEGMAEDAGSFQMRGIEGAVRCFRLVEAAP